MVYSAYCRDKLSLSRIGGQSKPFIDKNLQLQIPEWDSHQSQTDHLYSPIYSHYMMGSRLSSYLFSSLNEAELYQAMLEAKNSYEAWKETQQKLKKTIKNSLDLFRN